MVATSVIRSANQGQSHGGVYLLDLESARGPAGDRLEEGSISWDCRGGDRELRHIAFWDGEVYHAASDEVFVYDSRFRPSRSFGNRYLKHCHETHADGGFLYLASAGIRCGRTYRLADS